MSIKVINVCGARPNFMKIAPLMAAYENEPAIEPVLLHTGQHYDKKMSDSFFDQLGIRKPDINLGVGSGSHAVQTAKIMEKFEPVIAEHKPDAVLVVGDVNSTIACALVASKLGVKVIHVEAGLRSFDRTMPEEINRVLTDAISDILFVTESSGVENLRNEGVADEKIHYVGNVMIDTLLKNKQRAEQLDTREKLGLEPGEYGFLTLHRPANVDDKDKLTSILKGLGHISKELPLIFGMHPRTRKNIENNSLEGLLKEFPGIRVNEPFTYLECLNLMSSASVVLTDSGGMQEETTILGVPCLTMRENTERPSTISEGTNKLVNPTEDTIIAAWEELKKNPPPAGRKPKFWDGKAAERIAEIMVQTLT